MSKFKLRALTIYCYRDEIKKDEMRGVYGLYEEEDTYIQCVGGET